MRTLRTLGFLVLSIFWVHRLPAQSPSFIFDLIPADVVEGDKVRVAWSKPTNGTAQLLLNGTVVVSDLPDRHEFQPTLSDAGQYQIRFCVGQNCQLSSPSRLTVATNSFGFFGFNIPNTVSDLLPIPGGKMLVSLNGNFTPGQRTLVQVLPDGRPDSEFSPGRPDRPAQFLARQSDGRIVLAGPFTQFESGGSNQPANWVARLHPTGGIDLGFAVPLGSQSEIRAMTVDAQNRILLAGQIQKTNESTRYPVIRCLPDGRWDTNFPIAELRTRLGTGTDVSHIALSPGQTVWLGANAETTFRLWRLDPDGHPNSSTNAPPESGRITSMVATDQSLHLGGYFLAGGLPTAILTLDSDGQFVPGTPRHQFGLVGSTEASRIVHGPKGSFFVVGTNLVDAAGRPRVALRLSSGLREDPDFIENVATDPANSLRFSGRASVTDDSTLWVYGWVVRGGFTLYHLWRFPKADVAPSGAPFGISANLSDAGRIELSWPSEVGSRFRIESRTDLRTGAWQAIEEITATESTTRRSYPFPARQGFFRAARF